MTIEQGVTLAVTVTTFLVTGADFLIRKWLEKHRDQTITKLNEKISGLEGELSESERDRKESEAAHDLAAAELAGKKSELHTLSTKSDQQGAELSGLRASHAANQKLQKTQENRIGRALKMEGAIWTQGVMAGTPRFRPLGERRTPIVSLLNLKGGVGKTTLTAYLGWALSRRGYRVLLVDLDLQGSLTSLFLDVEAVSHRAKSGGGLLQHFLTEAASKPKTKLLDYALPVPQLGSHARLVATSDRLAYAELNQTVQWLLRVGGKKKVWNGRHDRRMILRRALHAKGLYKRFDVILLDCPPLINLCCANALAASDYVLMPITPSLKSIERVTPLLQRVLEVKAAGVNPDLNVLGLVVNNTQGKSLTEPESDLLKELPTWCQDILKQPVYQFDTTIPRRTLIRDGESGFRPPDENQLAPLFEQLAEEFVKRLPSTCRQPDERPRKSREPAGGEG